MPPVRRPSTTAPVAVKPSPEPDSGAGWLGFYFIAQAFLAALLFIPGASAIRTATRVAGYGLAPAIGAWLWFHGGTHAYQSAIARLPRGRLPARFPALPWLTGTLAWLVVSIFHPNGYSLTTACGQVALYYSVLSPAYWADKATASSTQIGRLMAVLLACGALSALLGIAQIYRPDTFNPPVIPALSNQYQGENVMFKTDDGRKLLRPCGLTDTPGAASLAGTTSALLGLAWLVRPSALWKRLAGLAAAAAGLAVIYFSQARFPLVMLAASGVILFAIFIIQGRRAQAGLLAIVGTLLGVVALVWVARNVGTGVVERFAPLFAKDATSFYAESRGVFVEEAFNRIIWEYPLGYGLGWWGMIHSTFGDPARPSPIWAEVMWPAWIFDGGIPLMTLYAVAAAVAAWNSFKIALRYKSRELGFWAAVITASDVGILASCFSFTPFLAPLGLQFWLQSAALHAASERARAADSPPPTPNPPRGLRPQIPGKMP